MGFLLRSAINYYYRNPLSGMLIIVNNSIINVLSSYATNGVTALGTFVQGLEHEGWLLSGVVLLLPHLSR